MNVWFFNNLPPFMLKYICIIPLRLYKRRQKMFTFLLPSFIPFRHTTDAHTITNYVHIFLLIAQYMPIFIFIFIIVWREKKHNEETEKMNKFSYNDRFMSKLYVHNYIATYLVCIVMSDCVRFISMGETCPARCFVFKKFPSFLFAVLHTTFY